MTSIAGLFQDTNCIDLARVACQLCSFKHLQDRISYISERSLYATKLREMREQGDERLSLKPTKKFIS